MEPRDDTANPAAMPDSMIPLLTGYLMVAAVFKAGDLMRITGYAALPPDAFQIQFATGLVLRVTVSEAKLVQ